MQRLISEVKNAFGSQRAVTFLASRQTTICTAHTPRAFVRFSFRFYFFKYIFPVGPREEFVPYSPSFGTNSYQYSVFFETIVIF